MPRGRGVDIDAMSVYTPQSENLADALFDSAPVGFACLDRDFCFLRVNHALAVMNHVSVDEHIGRPMAEVAPAAWARVRHVLRRVLDTGEAEAHSDAVLYPLVDDDEIVGLGCLVVDTTAHRRANDEFRDVVLDTMAEGMFGLDAGGRMTFINAAASQMLGWSPDELRTGDVHDVVHFQRSDGTPLSAHDCGVKRVGAAGQAVHAVDATFRRRDGTLLPVSYSAAPLTRSELGRGSVVVFRDATDERADQELAKRRLHAVQWLRWTREAIDEDRLVLYAQPIVPLGAGLPSEELLLRMIGRDGEVIAPGRFLPVAEEYGLIGEIDRWVIAQAARIAAEGRRIEVNLSATSVDPRLLAYIETQLADAGADPANITFELTETGLIRDIAIGESFARGLADIGCGLALDDFGTGFGSLTYLKVLPIQSLKIDIEFVRELATNAANQHLVKTIVGLARGFGHRTVAEGVEDEETLALLREYGVDFAQGYHLGRPAPLERYAGRTL
jgi:PAS domain S-box-containing protein